MSHEIIGDDMQAVILSLSQGDAVRAEAGAMMFMTESIEMDAKMEGGLPEGRLPLRAYKADRGEVKRDFGGMLGGLGDLLGGDRRSAKMGFCRGGERGTCGEGSHGQFPV